MYKTGRSRDRRQKRSAASRFSGNEYDTASVIVTGIRVLDLTNVLSGPFATLHLALLGAEVIKIENPRRPTATWRASSVVFHSITQMLMGTSYLAQNANKKSLTLNLKAAEGKEIFEKLVATADVVVENFRPDVMGRLGLAYDVLEGINPRLDLLRHFRIRTAGPDALNPPMTRSSRD